jgi:hypothetical protein
MLFRRTSKYRIAVFGKGDSFLLVKPVDSVEGEVAAKRRKNSTTTSCRLESYLRR